MIVVGIVAILTALAYPSYIQYVRKAKRGDAQHLLMNWSINEEIWRSNHTEYTAGDGMVPGTTTHYSYSAAAGPTTYTLTAAAQNDQLNDVARNGDSCSTLTLDQNGQKLPAECWE